jgi:predicted nucleic acid-binding protein
MLEDRFVIDACTLLNFYCRLEREDCLRKLFRSGLKITSKVRDEVLSCAEGPGKLRLLSDIESGFLKVEYIGTEDIEDFDMLEGPRNTLDPGELSSAALAIARRYIFITDDRRAQGDLLGTGVICRDSRWIIREAAKRRCITTADKKRLLDALKPRALT